MNIDISQINSKNTKIATYIEFVIEELKIFFDEILPLMFFLKMQEKNIIKLKYTAGNQKGDAVLDDKTTVEITKAQHKNKYVVIQDLIKHGFAFFLK